MHDMSAATELLKAGHSIGREGSNHTNAQFFLKNQGRKAYLFQRIVKARTGEVIESPATFDWADMSATNWTVIN